MPGQAGLAGQEQGNVINAINAMSGTAANARGVEQAQLDAPYEAQMGQWQEALNAMYRPLGFLGNMGGSTSTQSKK